MSAPLQAGDILYYPPFNEHLLLLESKIVIDEDDVEKPAWTMFCLETGKETWYWEVCLEDEECYRRFA